MKREMAQEQKKGFTNQEIQAIEAERQDVKTWNVIHLLKDGNYWHANEWSGWLVAVIITDEMKRINGEYIFVGFQEKSLDKYIPKELQIDFKAVDNLRIDVTVELSAELGELSYERLFAMYKEWKDNTPLAKEKGEKGSAGNNPPFKGGDGTLPFDNPAIVPSVMSVATRPISRASGWWRASR